METKCIFMARSGAGWRKVGCQGQRSRDNVNYHHHVLHVGQLGHFLHVPRIGHVHITYTSYRKRNVLVFL